VADSELIVSDKARDRHERAMHASSGCDVCKFCGLLSNIGSKELTFVCRRNPPTVNSALVMRTQGPAWQAVTSWPQVSKNDWCGEFVAKLN
jgi:hypothetical protein